MHLSRVAVWLGLSVVAGAAGLGDENADSKQPVDARVERLGYFLRENRCPVSHLAQDFLDAADRHGLDWRLLPSISIVESGGGRQHRRNNIFGWNSARTGFESIRHGIHAVAERLANSKLYRNKSLDGILRTYNRRPEYARKVKNLMEKIDPVDPAVELSGERSVPAPDPAIWRGPVLNLASAPAPPVAWGAPLPPRFE